MKHLFCGLMALGLLVGLAGHANAQPTYSFTTVDVPGSFIRNSTFANGINSSGQIVGFYFDGRARGFLFDHGTYTTFDPPGSYLTIPTGINTSGQIVGR